MFGLLSSTCRPAPSWKSVHLRTSFSTAMASVTRVSFGNEILDVTSCQFFKSAERIAS